MGVEIPFCTPQPIEAAPGRFAALLRGSPEGCGVALLGLADDEGVRLNGGRIGAREGPTAFRVALARYGTAEPAGFAWPGVFDAGDIQPGATLAETHDRVSAAATALLEHGLVPVGIGGGHDLTYPLVRAVAQPGGPLSGVYLDAHLDVRAEEGSGMPFRRLVEEGHARSLAVHGLDGFANRADHVAWFVEHGGTIAPADAPVAFPSGSAFLSIDLDVLDQAHAPGVSAMNPCGWGPGRVGAWARAAGAAPEVRCMDIMELCPAHDERGRTARLAVRLLLEFLRGFAQRGGR